jgi:hypothetical protein
MPKRQNAKDGNEPGKLALSFFACPNGDCADFNRFNAGNLSVAEWMAAVLQNRQDGLRHLRYALQRLDWAEQRNSVLESAIDAYKRNKALPIS